ncbi:hypothetical protein MLD38_023571 [Melastoma candidum]|uniref:Uncharacterized protein n=1 Tax=Melastoma candidum TaxID=119954 RepID=A0ACB9NSA5_9MYRT|nr:hypothetical protein MLD38_023571 [Melastoma candidum]
MSESHGSSSFHNLQAEKDPESNFSLDLDRLLEDYLIKICAGQATDVDHVNFAEAALLVQGSVQVYSRKVEYLYSLVLHTLEFISNQGHQSQVADRSAPADHEESTSSRVPLEDEDSFWVSNDVPVDPKNLLDSSAEETTLIQQFVKAPANLVVLEGDCLDTSDAVGELESYLLASSELYHDFILLDRCDAETVNSFLSTNKPGDGVSNAWSSHKSFLSPRGRSGASAPKASAGKSCSNVNQSPHIGRSAGVDDAGLGCPANDDFQNYEFDNVSNADYASRDDDDSEEGDDPWKPLNPHEPGTLKVKPFKRVKGHGRAHTDLRKKFSLANIFPLARRHGTISPEFRNLWEKQHALDKKQNHTTSPPLFEKLRQSLIDGARETHNSFRSFEENGDDNEYDNGEFEFAEPNIGIIEDRDNNGVEEDEPRERHDSAACLGGDEAESLTSDPPVSLEDLCRSHLDALLANITETEMQTELAGRVSNWKQKIEQNLEEQESLPPFDIHEYGERVLDKLSHDEVPGSSTSFADIVRGQEKHDVARTFSALLQLVNNEDVHLDRRDGVSTLCYTAANSFYVGLTGQNRREPRIKLPSPKERVKVPLGQSPKGGRNKHRRQGSSDSLSERRSRMTSSKLGAVGCSREGKRQRSSGHIRPANEAVSNS